MLHAVFTTESTVNPQTTVLKHCSYKHSNITFQSQLLNVHQEHSSNISMIQKESHLERFTQKPENLSLIFHQSITATINLSTTYRTQCRRTQWTSASVAPPPESASRRWGAPVAGQPACSAAHRGSGWTGRRSAAIPRCSSGCTSEGCAWHLSGTAERWLMRSLSR